MLQHSSYPNCGQVRGGDKEKLKVPIKILADGDQNKALHCWVLEILAKELEDMGGKQKLISFFQLSFTKLLQAARSSFIANKRGLCLNSFQCLFFFHLCSEHSQIHRCKAQHLDISQNQL